MFKCISLLHVLRRSQLQIQSVKHASTVWKNQNRPVLCLQHWFRHCSRDTSNSELTDPEFKNLLKEIHNDFSAPTTISKSEVASNLDDMVVHESLDIKNEEQDVYDDYFITEQDEEQIEDVMHKNIPISLTRGSAAVFELDELLTVLREENAQDIRVLDVPPELNYVQHMIIVSGRSRRHLRAMAEWISKLYKMKKNPNDSHLSISNKADTEWVAIDLGNVALQLFMPETRAYYDLETLWTTGGDPQHVQDAALELTPLDELWSRVQAWEAQPDDGTQTAETSTNITSEELSTGHSAAHTDSNSATGVK